MKKLNALLLIPILFLPLPTHAQGDAPAAPAPSTHPCAPPLARQPTAVAPISWYASGVLGTTEVLTPTGALGPEDGTYAVLTATSVLTLTWSEAFDSGVAVAVYLPKYRDCPYVWMTITHVDDAGQPLHVTETYVGAGAPGFALVRDGDTLDLPLHHAVVFTANTTVNVDAVFYARPRRRGWFPIVLGPPDP